MINLRKARIVERKLQPFAIPSPLRAELFDRSRFLAGCGFQNAITVENTECQLRRSEKRIGRCSVGITAASIALWDPSPRKGSSAKGQTGLPIRIFGLIGDFEQALDGERLRVLDHPDVRRYISFVRGEMSTIGRWDSPHVDSLCLSPQDL
jgi:hypothetical protein